jgi:hypothetical protein
VSRFALGPVDEETQRYIRIRKDKQAQLGILEEQAAKFGDMYVPPYLKMQIGALQDELSMVESAIKSPARSIVSDELGPAGRFAVNHQEGREVKQMIAALAIDLETAGAQSLDWRRRMEDRMRRLGSWNIVITILVVLILVAGAIFVTYVLTKGAL